VHDFDFDAMQKKRIARGAANRKRGSKSKKCALPSDNLTTGQWKRRNGKVMSYQLNKPMAWADFKAMPLDIQSEYLSNLIHKYGANSKSLGDMFGVTAQGVRDYVKRNNLGITFEFSKMSEAERDIWEAFIRDEISDIPKVPAPLDAAVAPVPDTAQQVVKETCHATEKHIIPTGFTLVFTGEIDVEVIANSMLKLLGSEATGEIEIIFSQS